MPKKEYENRNIRKILNQKENMQKNKYQENPEQQKVYKKEVSGQFQAKKEH